VVVGLAQHHGGGGGGIHIMADRQQRGAMTGRGQDTVPKDMP
jgi:hypothetical protein